MDGNVDIFEIASPEIRFAWARKHFPGKSLEDMQEEFNQANKWVAIINNCAIFSIGVIILLCLKLNTSPMGILYTILALIAVFFITVKGNRQNNIIINRWMCSCNLFKCSLYRLSPASSESAGFGPSLSNATHLSTDMIRAKLVAMARSIEVSDPEFRQSRIDELDCALMTASEVYGLMFDKASIVAEARNDRV